MSVLISSADTTYNNLTDKDKQKIKDAIDAYLQGTSLDKGQEVKDRIKLTGGLAPVHWRVTAVEGKVYKVLVVDML